MHITAVDEASTVVQAAQAAVDTFGSTTATAQLNATDNASSVISGVQDALSALDGQRATVTIDVVQNGSVPGDFASGTPYAPSGLAVLNDDGSADPRELVVHNGAYMMYEGRDVLTNLSAGDRVFTSAQTKSILSGEGIPHYAEGLNNETDSVPRSDALIGEAVGGRGVNVGGITVQFNLSGQNGGEIVEEIRQNAAVIAEMIVDVLDQRLSDSFANS